MIIQFVCLHHCNIILFPNKTLKTPTEPLNDGSFCNQLVFFH